MTPSVSIAVLSYRRREALARVLDSALLQDYPALEVIVADNGSGEETTGYIQRHYPQVRLIALPENIGTAARNRALEAARGSLVVMLDNDVYFDDPLAIRRIVESFERHPRAGCVVFRVCHPATGRLHVRDWCHPRSWRQAEAQEFETDYITEGAAAFRREVFDRIEPYWPLLFIGHEGFDLSLRLLDAGYEIWYAPEVKVWHMASIETRPNWRPFYYYTRNLFPVICRNYPWALGLLHLAPRLAVLAVRSLQAGAFRRYLAGLVDGLRMIPQTRALRRPIRQETLRKIAALRRCQPGLLERFATAKDRLMPLSPRT